MNIDKVYNNENYIYNKDLHSNDNIHDRKKNKKNNITILNNYRDYKRQDDVTYNYVLFSLNKNGINNSSELKLNELNDNKMSSKIKKKKYQNINNNYYNQKSNKMVDKKGNYLDIIKSVPLKKNYISINNSFSIDNDFYNSLYFRKNHSNCCIYEYFHNNNKYNTYLNNRNNFILKKKAFLHNKKISSIYDLNTYEYFNVNINNICQMNSENHINKINNIKYNSNLENINHYSTCANFTASNINDNAKKNNLYYQRNNVHNQTLNNNSEKNVSILSKNSQAINSNYSNKSQYLKTNSNFKRNLLQLNNIYNYEKNKILDYSIFNTSKINFHYSNKNYNVTNSCNKMKINKKKNHSLNYCPNNNFIRINTPNNKKSIISYFNKKNKNDNNEIVESLSKNEKYSKVKKKKINNFCSSFIFSNKCFYEDNKIEKKKNLCSKDSSNCDNKLTRKNREASELKNSTYFIDLLLNGEKEAKNIIDKAYQNKKKLRKLMHEKIEEEIENFKQKENLKYEESYKKMEEEIKSEQLIENELQIISTQMQTNSLNINEASNYIINKIINVDLTLSYDLLKYYLPMKDILTIHLDLEQKNNQQNIKKKDTLIIDEQGNSSILHYNQYKNEHTVRKFGSFWTRIRHNK
ncbi:conserved Plasmodium protein, unknown function [Plasmodium relictum]|uniref:Uncharacterized protein n=1 Tax=Plasmodium relictum TaxID=85471 RepID=A0A1J1H7C6_PLARL|nr:conserved Plasmodium protein, unknown function [Plasmodium relictum]CRH00818.1 conserved Plasmodium protein, unknown function [Plasmodium relictum]